MESVEEPPRAVVTRAELPYPSLERMITSNAAMVSIICAGVRVSDRLNQGANSGNGGLIFLL